MLELQPELGTIYLAHGYDTQTKEIGLRVQSKLEQAGLIVINPFQRGEQALYEKYIADKQDFPPEICARIVETDLDKIDQSAAVVAIPSLTSIGTFMEIFYASYMYDKPVWTLWIHKREDRGHQLKHPWLDYLTKLYMGAEHEDAVVRDVIMYFKDETRRIAGGA